MESPTAAAPDPLMRLLELGLAGLLILAPLPLGSVGARGRLMLELGALLLGLLWVARSWIHASRLPSAPVRWGLLGLIALAMLQIAPLGKGFVSVVSPRTDEIRSMTVPGPPVLATEGRIIGVDPSSLEAAPALSVDPGATASALRTGAALAALLLVATSVAAERGVRRLALALLISAAFQGLYGVLVLASGYNRIWNLPKVHYLTAATGTYVNKNHYACLLAVSLACGMALVLHDHRQARRSVSGRWMIRWFSAPHARILLLGMLLILGTAGLLASLSRAGITLGLLALVGTALIAGRDKALRVRVVIVLLVLAFAAVPLVQIGSEQLVARYSESAEDLTVGGGRMTVWRDTLRLAAAFPACGAGFGTFAVAYPLYRSSEVRLFYRHAHNDLVQLLAEGGAAGLLFTLLLLVPVLLSIVRAVGGGRGTLAVGFAAGLTAFLLHSLIDFNLHIPANAATAAVLAGALQGLAWTNESSSS